ncbi:MAG: hypothetical protein KGO47_07355 [Cyanobacteria bacterium REEB417]|nr:hypothetical protein [Cyanobacteria bacterium REEB417]
MSCPTVIRVATGTGPPGIGLPAGTADAGKFVQKDGASPYQYRLVTPDQVGLPQGLAPASSPTFAGLTLSGQASALTRLLVVGNSGQVVSLAIGTNLAIIEGALVAAGGSGGGGGGFPSLSMPLGFSVSGSGTAALAVTFAPGYSLPTNAAQASWTAGAALAATSVQEGDVRLADSREWSAATMTQAEAEEGLSTVRRATNALRLRQAAAAWWAAASGAVGKLLAAATTQAEARSQLGLGTAAVAAATDFATPAALASGLAAKADLVGGVVPTSQIPAIAISEYLGAAASQGAMLALVGQRGDWCIRTDSGAGAGAWMLAGEPSSLLANWVQIPMPAVPVQSINGQVGAVVLGPADVGAATAAQGAKADTAIQPGNAALSDAREWSAETITQAEAEAGTTTTRRAFTAQRVRQAAAAWWLTVSGAVGRSVAAATTQAEGRTALGLGTAATAASGDFLPRTIETVDVAYAATINIDFAADNGKTLAVATLTGPVTFTFSNIAQGRAVSVDLLCDGTQRALTFPAATPFIGSKPSNIAAGKAASLSFECRRSGTTDASVRAAYGVQS